MSTLRKISRKTKGKSHIFRLLGPHHVRKLQSLLSKRQIEEVDLVYDYFRSEAVEADRLMVDVGAHYGTSLGRFAADGWNVHAFEPDDHNRAVLEIRHGYRKNLTINSSAASDTSGGEAEFFTSEVSTGISGLNAFDTSHTSSQKVPLVRLDDYCFSNGIDRIDFLKIDTEGHDLIVLRGLDLAKICTDVILCEFEDKKTLPRGYDRKEMADYLSDQGYQIVVSEWFPIEAYGARHRWKGFRNSMVETGPDSWGNIIAFRDKMPSALIARYARRSASI
ncbi:MAG: hypothetical protein APF78_07680 [Sphingomonadales bacterium BRH_c3]|nr:MAG: hypothetical protein APF78_07680 [Sphingomonadales bacterium BRH_c3]